MSEKTLTLTIVTAEGSVVLDANDPASMNAAVQAIMDAQVNRELDDVDASQLSDEDLLCRNLRDLAEKIDRLNGKISGDVSPWGARKYGADFKNETFEMHPYWWGECRCEFEQLEDAWTSEHPYWDDARACFVEGYNEAYTEWLKDHGHASDCPEHPANTHAGLPNFRCGDVSVDWYKYIGRDMNVSRELTRGEIEALFKTCFESLEPTLPDL